MSVKSEWGMCCPHCKEDDGLSVQIKIVAMAKLSRFGTDFDGADHEWNDDSACECDCGFSGKVRDFKDPAKCAPPAIDPMMAALRDLLQAMESPRSRKATAAWTTARKLANL